MQKERGQRGWARDRTGTEPSGSGWGPADWLSGYKEAGRKVRLRHSPEEAEDTTDSSVCWNAQGGPEDLPSPSPEPRGQGCWRCPTQDHGDMCPEPQLLRKSPASHRPQGLCI